MQPKKVLIILHGAIGDITRALPLAHRIKRAWPETQLIWGVEPRSKDVLKDNPHIDKLIVFERADGLMGYLRYLRALRAEQAELCLDLQRIFKSGVAGFFSRAKRRIGFHPRNAKEFNWLFNTEYIDAVENFSLKWKHYQSFGDKLEIAQTEVDFGLPLIDSACLESLPQGRVVAFILGSTWSSRIWPSAHYIELIRLMRKHFEAEAVLVGGPAEQELSDEIIQAQPEVSSLVGKTKLYELPMVFSRCVLAVGSDSGPMHIAAAAGIPVVSLWGSTSPLRSAPYQSEHLVLQSPIGCSPCYKRRCPGLDTLCMEDIPPQAVIAQMSQFFPRK